MRRLAKVNDLEIAEQFLSYYGGVTGVSPVEGGSGKAEGFEAWGETSPLLDGMKGIYSRKYKRYFDI
ncbi:MAG: hypothetical protein LBQ88_08440 [Treponema sp.]|nr:hypothetical protein [Treponema sp.]